jgi:hypothetical protein
MLPVLLLVTTVATLGSSPSPRTPEFPHVRATAPRVQKLIVEAARRSATFAELYARLQDTDIIVFVELSDNPGRNLRGRLVFLSATPLARYLRAEIRSDLARTDMISTIAHEMQHALEIAQAPLVRNAAALAVLYREIGLREETGCFETTSAQDVARRVRRELLA